MTIKNKETGKTVELPDGRIVAGWWTSDVKMISYPVSDWEEVKADASR